MLLGLVGMQGVHAGLGLQGHPRKLHQLSVMVPGQNMRSISAKA